jgi:3-hydroxyisobutyrate dehydrogenase-like beta-hydroxyacid dehydrogenase
MLYNVIPVLKQGDYCVRRANKMSSLRVGFIGLGNMGMLMAKTLVKNGEKLVVFDLKKEAVVEMEALGATAAASSREVAAKSEVIFSIVRDELQTDEVIFGNKGVWQGIKAGSTIIISSTISPAYCRRLYAGAKEKGVHIVDAAVSTESRNFTPGQESAVFTLMIGGDEDAVKRCWPVFEALTKNNIYLGGSGNGAACKLVNNLAMYCNTVVARECLNLGIKAGLEMDRLVEAMRLSTGYSRGLNLAARGIRQPRPVVKPVVAEKAIKSLDEKDNETAMELAQAVGANTPVAGLMLELDQEKTYGALYKK